MDCVVGLRHSGLSFFYFETAKVITPWPHAPYTIGKVEKNVGERTWHESWVVYLAGEMKASFPTYEKAEEFCLRDQRKIGGRSTGVRG